MLYCCILLYVYCWFAFGHYYCDPAKDKSVYTAQLTNYAKNSLHPDGFLNLIPCIPCLVSSIPLPLFSISSGGRRSLALELGLHPAASASLRASVPRTCSAGIDRQRARRPRAELRAPSAELRAAEVLGSSGGRRSRAAAPATGVFSELQRHTW